MLGHCLGGQLISKALGAKVTQNPVKEIGWGNVAVSNTKISKDWFDVIEAFYAFHWHGETFSLPDGAQLILSSPHCANQGYVIGKHLVLQTHIEVSSDMVKNWCVEGAEELAGAIDSPAVQQADMMQEDLPLHYLF